MISQIEKLRVVLIARQTGCLSGSKVNGAQLIRENCKFHYTKQAWSISIHQMLPRRFKQTVLLLLLLQYSADINALGYLPSEMIIQIVETFYAVDNF